MAADDPAAAIHIEAFGEAQNIRELTDYDLEYIPPEGEARLQVDAASRFTGFVRDLVND